MSRLDLPNKIQIYVRYFIRRFAYVIPPSEIKNVLLRASGISIGKKVFVGDGVRFIDGFNRNLIDLEDQCVLSPGVILIACSYPENSPLADLGDLNRMARIVIGKGSWIGAGTVLLPGSGLGQEAVIGAGSVLTRIVGVKEIWTGNPARHLRTLSDGLGL